MPILVGITSCLPPPAWFFTSQPDFLTSVLRTDLVFPVAHYKLVNYADTLSNLIDKMTTEWM